MTVKHLSVYLLGREALPDEDVTQIYECDINVRAGLMILAVSQAGPKDSVGKPLFAPVGELRLLKTPIILNAASRNEIIDAVCSTDLAAANLHSTMATIYPVDSLNDSSAIFVIITESCMRHFLNSHRSTVRTELRYALLSPPEDKRLNVSLFKRLDLIKSYANSPPPSQGIQDPKDIAEANTGQHGVCTGRPFANRGPPVALFSPDLAKFVYALEHLDEVTPIPTPEFLQRVEEFLVVSAKIYTTEDFRVTAISSFFDALLGQGEWNIATNLARADVRWGPYTIGEITNELGLAGDPRLQAALTYRHVASDTRYYTYVQRTNCPAILLGVSGAQLTISVAVITDSIYVDHLYISDLIPGRDPDAKVLHLAQVFMALQTASAALAGVFRSSQQLQWQTDPSPFFPRPFSLHSASLPDLAFIGKLSRSGHLVLPCTPEYDSVKLECLFVARLDEKEVVVKFARRYNHRAHSLLADHQYAPRLLSIHQVQEGYTMVVMEWIVGETFFQRGGPASAAVQQGLTEAVDILHRNNLVHGDLRAPNIIIETGTDQVKILDFDWAGEVEVARYPARLSNVPHTWHPGVERMGIMQFDHDLYLVNKLLEM